MLPANEVYVQQLRKRVRVVQLQIDQLRAKLGDGLPPEKSGSLNQAATWLSNVETQCISKLLEERDAPLTSIEESGILASAEVPLEIAISLVKKVKDMTLR